jgi:uncharacterized membrane protein YgdD (TMEM256/DUF423 family)
MLQTDDAVANTAMQRLWIVLGGLAGFAAVAAAAVGAHAVTAEARPLIASAAQMQGWHALALVAVGLWSPTGGRLAHAAGIAFLLGMVLFCVGVDYQAFTGVSPGPVAPTGGILLMIGWLLLAGSALQRPRIR